MARMKRAFPLLFLLLSSSAFASSILDIGTNYRMRAISMSKVDYGLTPNQD
jgi:hypothetical protein